MKFSTTMQQQTLFLTLFHQAMTNQFIIDVEPLLTAWEKTCSNYGLPHTPAS